MVQPQRIKQIAVLTSGGDSPGMNACLRAVVRRGLEQDMLVWGVRDGYAGLVHDDTQIMTARDVGGILDKGGTILRTARCPDFKLPAVRRETIERCRQRGIEGLVVIGGDGSLTGAQKLHDEGFAVVGVPGSIDNDLWGTDFAIGADSALNVIMGAVGSIKDTSNAMGRAHLVEVMGRHAGYLAALSGLSCGAEMVAIPGVYKSMEALVNDMGRRMEVARLREKPHFIAILAEGVPKDDLHTTSAEIALALEAHYKPDKCPYEPRATVLGHIQRGGSPTQLDRVLATMLGAAAVDLLRAGKSGVMVGWRRSNVVQIPLAKVIDGKRSGRPWTNLDRKIVDLVASLSS